MQETAGWMIVQQLSSHKIVIVHVNISFNCKTNSSFYLLLHCDSITKQARMGIFCYTVYSECIVLCLWKLCFKLYFHMFCWGQSTLSLKVTEVLELKATYSKSCQEKLLISVNEITFKINRLWPKINVAHGKLFIMSATENNLPGQCLTLGCLPPPLPSPSSANACTLYFRVVPDNRTSKHGRQKKW